MSSKRIPISIAARLIYHLGEQLISDEFVALLELIKNSYDADATRCVVKVDSNAMTEHGQGYIRIIDNGNGMLPHTVEKDFLRLATDYKKTNKISPYYKRRTLGEKGLGRLSYQRLGRYVQVHTTPRIDRLKDLMSRDDIEFCESHNYNAIDITMDWDGFSDSEDIGNVFATVTEQHDVSAKPGTIIEILGIRNTNFWDLNQEKRIRLQDEILALINPFVESKSNGAFNLELDVNGEQFYIDSIDEKVVNQLSDVSGHFTFDGHILSVWAEFKPKYITRQKDQYIKRCKAGGFELLSDKFSPEKFLYRNFCANLDQINGWEMECQLPKSTVNLIDGKPATDFVFDGSLYIVDKQTANRTEIDKNILTENKYIKSNFQRIGKLWDHIAGVYMYRDQFRILPYGKDDWLNFTARSQKSKATILKQGNVCGYVHINGEKSEAIREQTNRQGILEDENGSNFLIILNKIITDQIFQWDVEIRREFTAPKEDLASNNYCNVSKSITFKKITSPEEGYLSAETKFNSAISQAKEKSSQTSLFEVDTLKKKVDELAYTAESYRAATNDLRADYSQRITLARDKISEYEEVLPLLGQTMIVEAATHELSRIYSNMVQSTRSLSDFSLSLVPPSDQLKKIILLLKNHISELDLQLNHILPTQRYKVKGLEWIEMGAFLRSQYVEKSAVTSRLKSKGIECDIKGTPFSIHASRGNLIVIFDNIVMNSEYWLTLADCPAKAIHFEFQNNREIRIWDSGFGIDKQMEDYLFEPFQTMKRDGRGLGLYIVRELLALMGASIELLQERNSNGNRYIFKIVFQEK